MEGEREPPNKDGPGFDSTVYARPKPTSYRGVMGPASRGPVQDPSSLPFTFGPAPTPVTRTTLRSPESRTSPSRTPTPTASSSPKSTTQPPTTSEEPQPTKEPEPESKSREKSISKESSSSTSIKTTPTSSATPTPTPTASSSSTLETIIIPSSSSLSQLEPSVAPLPTIEPSAPVESSTAFASPSSSRSVPPPASHTENASSLQNTEGSEKGTSSSGAKIGGAVGGVSAAILIGLLLFVWWKWRTKGRHRFNQRSSFDPYGNGIDANEGGLLVSSVAKPSDQLSDSDDHSPTRYQHLEKRVPREPTIPVIEEPQPRTYSNSFPRTRTPKVNEQTREPFPPSSSPNTHTNGAVQHPLRTHQSPSRPYPLLYERRRPPVPPSMRRNRSPPERYDMVHPAHRHHGLEEPIPGIYALPARGFASPYPRNANIMKSNSINTHVPSRHPDLARMERNHRIRRSASMSNINHRGMDPNITHSSIAEGRSTQSHNQASGRYHRPRANSSNSVVHPRGGNTYVYHDAPQQHSRRALTVRNPTPVMSGVEKQATRKPLADMVRRATTKQKGDERPQHRPEHAAQNF